MVSSVGIYMGVLNSRLFNEYFQIEDAVLFDIDKMFNIIMDEK